MKSKIVYTSRGEEYYVEGQRVSKKKFDSLVLTKPLGVAMLAGNTSECWPMKSDALAIHPSQIKAVMEHDRKHGIATEYDPKDGRCIIKDQGQYRDLLKLRKMHQNNGGYGTDHHISERAPAIDPKVVEAAKFIDSIPVRGF